MDKKILLPVALLVLIVALSGCVDSIGEATKSIGVFSPGAGTAKATCPTCPPCEGDMVKKGEPRLYCLETGELTMYEGEQVYDLQGRNDYKGQLLSLKLAAVTQAGAADEYQAQFELYDEQGTLIDTKTVDTGTRLDKVFVDSDGDYALETPIYVKLISIQEATGVGYAIIKKCKQHI